MHASGDVVKILAIFAVLGFGMFLVLYGTVAKNRWGINLEPVSCPRCGTILPKLREPGSLRQAMWGGSTCPKCGVEVDKWGRKVAPVGPRSVVRTEPEMRKVLKKRIVFAGLLGFLLILLLDWTGITDSGFPSTWAQALFQIADDALDSVILILIFYFGISRLLDHLSRTTKGRDPAPVQEPNHKP
jgi:hypothetical protein